MPQLQTGRYRVRIATDACDLRAARQLRFRCFRAPALVSAWAGPEAETGEDADPVFNNVSSSFGEYVPEGPQGEPG